MDAYDYGYLDSENMFIGCSSSNYNSDSDSDWPRYSHNCGNFKPITAPKLENMASVSVAIALWNRATVAIPGITVNNQKWCVLLQKKVPKWIDALPIPKSLAVPIKCHFNYVSFNVEEWISYIFRTVFLKRGNKSDLYRHIKHIFWYPNGAINFAQTARNLLRSDELTEAEKFHLACTYCLQDEIERMWTSTEDVDDIVDEHQFSRYPLVSYWRYYYASKLDRIQVLENLPVDEIMIEHNFVDNWLAIEYFFDRLSAEQQVAKAIWLITERTIRFQKLLLTKLNESQRLLVIMEKIDDILYNYLTYWDIDDNMENCIATWYDVCDLITEDRFVVIFNVLIICATENSMPILTEIWKTARDNLKRHALNYSNNDFIARLLKSDKYRSENGFNFLSSVVSYCDSVIKREITKKEVFAKLCKRLICSNAVKLLNKIMNLFLPEAAESTEFKLSLSKRRHFGKHCKALIIDYKLEALARLLDVVLPKTHPSSAASARTLLGKHLGNLDYQCLTYYSTGNLKRLNDMLAPLASSYPEIVYAYKCKLLMTQNGFNACINHFGSTNNVLAEITADLPTNLANRFKKNIIFSPEGIDKMHNMVVNGPPIVVEKYARWFLESDSDRKKLRQLLIDRMKEAKDNVPDKIKKRFLEFLL